MDGILRNGAYRISTVRTDSETIATDQPIASRLRMPLIEWYRAYAGVRMTLPKISLAASSR